LPARKAGIAVAVLALGLGSALLVRGRFDASPTAPIAGQTTAPLTSASEARAPSPATHPTSGVATALPPDVTRALESGPKEPLTPPVIRLEVEIADRGAFTAEPLTPPVIHLETEIEGRGTSTAAPLTPPVIHLDAEADPRSIATAEPRGRPAIAAPVAPATR
jgi:hypothetical protein